MGAHTGSLLSTDLHYPTRQPGHNVSETSKPQMYFQDSDSENTRDSLTSACHPSFNRALGTQHRMRYTCNSIFVIVVQS